MKRLPHLFENNRAWVGKVTDQDPEFFSRLSSIQKPDYLWIGCSDSRVPANQITGLQPGEVFVHRNVANVVVHSDLNFLSVLQYAIDVLQVSHVIVCGHYGCGGVRAAVTGERLGLVDNWLRHIKDVRDRHADLFGAAMDTGMRWDRLCELNVIEQVRHVTQTTIVRDAWKRGHKLTVHGWIYRVNDGMLHDMNVSVERSSEADPVCDAALKELL